ncbi:MAG: YbjN domain-containing protein [Lachnospiraceae bacterium]|nr:YbjN domain-containing protein [Lachnospiraceae bacterium]
MKKQFREKVLKQLQKTMNECAYETEYIDDEDGQSLMIMVDELGEDEMGQVQIELSFEDNNEGAEEVNYMDCLTIFGTFDFNIDVDRINELYDEINKINLTTVLGSFQIFKEEEELFYKYSLFLSGEDEAKISDDIEVVLNWIFNMFDLTYDSMEKLVCGDE